MADTDTYTRVISTTEAREGHIRVTRDGLSFFPPVGQEFRISRGTNRQTVKIEGRPCTCRGPEEPHEHYFISWPGMRAGDRVVLSRQEQNGGYEMEVHHQDQRRCG